MENFDKYADPEKWAEGEKHTMKDNEEEIKKLDEVIRQGSLMVGIKNISSFIIKSGYRKLPTNPNGGYFGTHCHICHEAVGVCRCGKLVELDEKALSEMRIPTTCAEGFTYLVPGPEIAKAICAKFGTHPQRSNVPTVEEIVHIIKDNYGKCEDDMECLYCSTCANNIGQAIHARLTRPKDEGK